jgi:hypothetical protein
MIDAAVLGRFSQTESDGDDLKNLKRRFEGEKDCALLLRSQKLLMTGFLTKIVQTLYIPI